MADSAQAALHAMAQEALRTAAEALAAGPPPQTAAQKRAEKERRADERQRQREEEQAERGMSERGTVSDAAAAANEEATEAQVYEHYKPSHCRGGEMP